MKESITFESVSAAADKLVAERLPVSVRNLRHHIGHGSHSTIAECLRQWHDNRQQQITPASALTSQIQKVLLDEIACQVSAASVSLKQQLASEQDNLGVVLQESKERSAKLDECAAELVVLSTQLQRQAGQIDQLMQSLTEARDETRQQRADAESLREALVKERLKLEAVPTIHAENDALRKEIGQAKEARADSVQAAAVAEVARASAEKQLADMKVREEALAAKLDKAEAELRIAADRERSLRDSLAHAMAAMASRPVIASDV